MIYLFIYSIIFLIGHLIECSVNFDTTLMRMKTWNTSP
jgi:hypothetical protein